jgi:hypothetical protein
MMRLHLHRESKRSESPQLDAVRIIDAALGLVVAQARLSDAEVAQLTEAVRDALSATSAETSCSGDFDRILVQVPTCGGNAALIDALLEVRTAVDHNLVAGARAGGPHRGPRADGRDSGRVAVP